MLGGATLATTDATIYTVPTNAKASVSVFLTNFSATNVTVTVKLSDGTNTFVIFQGDLPPNGTVQLTNIGLNSGDSIVASASAGTSVDCVVTGVEV